MTDRPDLRCQPGPHVFVEDLLQPVLAESDRHHLAKSLRLRSGDPLTLSDGNGNWCTARFGSELEVTGEHVSITEPRYQVALGVALTKASKPEFAVQKATELGVDRVVIFPAAHSVVRWDESKQLRQAQRLATVAREAAMQSRRVRVPTVELVDGLDHLAGEVGVVRADFGGAAPSDAHRMILIGPEGGWSEKERTVVRSAVDLGPTVLRAETAAVVASTFLVTTRG